MSSIHELVLNKFKRVDPNLWSIKALCFLQTFFLPIMPFCILQVQTWFTGANGRGQSHGSCCTVVPFFPSLFVLGWLKKECTLASQKKRICSSPDSFNITGPAPNFHFRPPQKGTYTVISTREDENSNFLTYHIYSYFCAVFHESLL